MTQAGFNLDNPFEKEIYDRLIKYLKRNMTHDGVLTGIAADFPYLEERLRACCEHMVFEFFNKTGNGEFLAAIKKLAVLHINDRNEPFNSYKSLQFLLNGQDDIALAINIENPFYTLKEAVGCFVVTLNDIEVSRFSCRMRSDERTQSILVPLDIFNHDVIKMGDICRSLTVRVTEENVPDHQHELNFDVSYLSKTASEMFCPYYIGVHHQESYKLETCFSQKDLESLYLRVEMGVPPECSHLHAIEANVVFLKKNAKSDQEHMTTTIHLFKKDNGDFSMDRKICYCDPETELSDSPTYIMHPGKYTIGLVIWNDIIWTEELTIYAEEIPEKAEDNSLDDFEKTLDSFIETMWLEQQVTPDMEFIMLDSLGNEISGTEREGMIFHKHVPHGFRLNIKFDPDYMPICDIEVSVQTGANGSRERQLIRRQDIIASKTRKFTLDFESTLTSTVTHMTPIYVILEEPDGSLLKKSEYLAIHFEDPAEFLDVRNLQLYNIERDKDGLSFTDYIESLTPQTAFIHEQMNTLRALCIMKNIKSLDFNRYSTCMDWFLYDGTGRLVGASAANIDDNGDILSVHGNIEPEAEKGWEKGEYRLELLWYGHSMLNATFRVGDIQLKSDYDPDIIKKKANIQDCREGEDAMARLDKMAGLKKVKDKIHSLVNFAKLQQQRTDAGLPAKTPMLHARFLGNPGTGKTTVARLLGQIYKEMGLLSSGHVVLEERKNLIGRYYDSDALAVENALNRAKGGILLIDEAYNLYVENDEKDPGRRILENLLTALSDENNRDWMLILAGYPDEMERMLNSNPGIKSRLGETFIFEDLEADELMQVAELYCEDNSYELSEEARKRLAGLISHEYENKDRHFGNGRYVNRLMEGIISTNMATRLSKIEAPTYDQLITIEAEDIRLTDGETGRSTTGAFDEELIDKALERLDSLVGLVKVKSAIHNFVNIARYLNRRGEKFTGKGLLKWNFTGNTGTGKSTVAQILADILKAMNLIRSSEVTEIKGEEIFNVSDYECNMTLKEAVRKTRKGMLLIDGDAPDFRSSEYRLTREQVRFKLASLAGEDKATGALVISECSSPKLSMAHSLANNGIYDYDHTFIFDDYTQEELYDILVMCLEKHNVTISEEAEAILREYIRNLCNNRDLSFANARTMKNLSRAIFESMLLRLSNRNGEERTVLGCDVESFVWNQGRSRIGF